MEGCHHQTIVQNYLVGKAANSRVPLAGVPTVSVVYRLAAANYYFWMVGSLFLFSNRQISETGVYGS